MTTQNMHFNLSDIDMLHRAMVEHAAMAHDVGEVKSFPVELAMIAAVLHEQNMPQESINKVLAVRCGLPVQAVDHRSPYFVWVSEEAPGESEKHRIMLSPGEFINRVRDDLFLHTSSGGIEAEFTFKIDPTCAFLGQSEQTVRIPLVLRRKEKANTQE